MMDVEATRESSRKRHVVCMPYPVQGHIKPMLCLAKLLHSRYHFHVSFVNTEHNHRRFLKSHGPTALSGLPSFRFYSIPDGLPPASNPDATQDIPSLSASAPKAFPGPFRALLSRINCEDVPAVSCLVSDTSLPFMVDVATDIGLPLALFWTSSPCSFLGFAHYQKLIDSGLIPLPDSSCIKNGYLDKVIDWIPSMEGISLKHLPSFIRTTDIDGGRLNLFIQRLLKLNKSNCPIILNTFEALDKDIIDALTTTTIRSPIFPIGPLSLLLENHHHHLATCPKMYDNKGYHVIRPNLWQEDPNCIPWLDKKPPNSVIYVNFGSVTILTHDQLTEFACGLANSLHNFLWIIRPDLVKGDSNSTTLMRQLVDETNGRGMLTSWCDQERVLAHPAIGAFLTHCGWNSTLEAIVGGVPVVCWPFFADQLTNSWFSCEKWGIGAEIDEELSREEVEKVVRVVMEGEEMRRRAREWKRLAQEATQNPNSSSFLKLDELVNHLTSAF